MFFCFIIALKAKRQKLGFYIARKEESDENKKSPYGLEQLGLLRRIRK